MMLIEIGEPAFDDDLELKEGDLKLHKGGLLEDSIMDPNASLYTITRGESTNVISTNSESTIGTNMHRKRRGSIIDSIASSSNHMLHSLSSNVDKVRRRASVAVKETKQKLTKQFMKQFLKSNEHGTDCFCGCRG